MRNMAQNPQARPKYGQAIGLLRAKVPLQDQWDVLPILHWKEDPEEEAPRKKLDLSVVLSRWCLGSANR